MRKKTRDTRVIWVLVYDDGSADLQWHDTRAQAQGARDASPTRWRGPYRVELPMAVARRICGES